MNKKAQLLDNPVIAFILVAFILLLIAPVMMKIFYSIRDPMSSSLGNISIGGATAQNNFNHVMNVGINMFDKIIIFCFIISIIMMFVSAFLIDAHPFFIFLYIFMAFMAVLFTPTMMESLDKIYNSADFNTATTSLTLVNAFRNGFVEIVIGLFVLTGIIIYGKVALFSAGGATRR